MSADELPERLYSVVFPATEALRLSSWGKVLAGVAFTVFSSCQLLSDVDRFEVAAGDSDNLRGEGNGQVNGTGAADSEANCPVAAESCSEGTRTCLVDGTWSECSALGTRTGDTGNGDNRNAEPEITTSGVRFFDQIMQGSVDKLDLLFMVDNSGSMSDKQEILRRALPDLVQRLVDPICIDAEGRQGASADTATGQCELGFAREFIPIDDINIAVITSSLGDVGANSTCPQGGVDELADMSHTIGSLARGQAVGANDFGFLEWRPTTANLQQFTGNFQRMIQAVGEAGCGWEASLESWYRFLVDPNPYKSLSRVPCGPQDQLNQCVQQTTNGADQIELDLDLLAQREQFLRRGSLVAILMLTDENDCSMQVGGQSWIVASNGNGQMYRSTSVCDYNSNDPCCYTCALTPPDGCTADPICSENPQTGALQERLAASEDALNLRCYQQKRRFGVDFLYPTRRYVNALTQVQLCLSNLDLSVEGCSADNIVDNPLYADGVRSQSLVFLGGIVGVPFQSIASTADLNGAPLEADTLRFKTWEELNAGGDWDKILGSGGTPFDPLKPETSGIPPVPPTDPYMIESEFERPGILDNNPINGRDWNTTNSSATPGSPPRDDLQYSCIFRLPTPRNCLEENGYCDCAEGNEDKPLCEDVPGMSIPGNSQYWAKAYPAIRQLEVLKAFGSNSIVASICTGNLDDDTRSDFGYRPAVTAIVEQLREQLTDRCLPSGLEVDEEGQVPCTLVETTPRLQAGESCVCDAAQGRQTPSDEVSRQIRTQMAMETGSLCGEGEADCSEACLCEVLQVQQVESNPLRSLEQCQNDLAVTGVQGWCYVSQDDGVSNPELVESCAATERRRVRFVGQGLRPNSTAYLSCNESPPAAGQERL